MDGPDASKSDSDRSDRLGALSRRDRDPTTESDDRGQDIGTRPRTRGSDAETIADDGIGRWLLETDTRVGTAIRDLVTIVAIIAISGSLLVGISGVWPPLVAVESGSMEPNIEQGDLVFIVDEGRFAGDGAVAGTNIVTDRRGHDSNYQRFGKPGDVIIFLPNGDPTKTPTIHRAQFRVEQGERWVETKADPAYLNGATCADLASCPAPHDGFITKGDANPAYDQVQWSGANTTVVSAQWVTGKAMVRVPWIGEIRLAVDSVRSVVSTGPIIVATVGSVLALIWYGTTAEPRDP
ncbi:S24/S26 family peptidase [Natrinema limicola]|uniref:Peptidase S24/S26A/S26B, conserved region n=1 Tax=Natrinema limicola JCM 13563 TaxID=1230457 RepID=M0CAC9_9EURY|nr:S26 family signal peptidase [Natrinema limicola]ELZ19307.1 Peptidase S24/S26A/S26B, conserved region [Natrinema limicola JCM 13563]